MKSNQPNELEEGGRLPELQDAVQEIEDADSNREDVVREGGSSRWANLPIVGCLLEVFDPKFVLSLGGCYLLNKGVASTLVFYSLQPMFMRRFETTSIRYQRMSSLGTMSYSLKPLVATLSDTFAFAGYTKRWYLVLACVIGAVFSLTFASLPAKPSSDNMAGTCVFLINFSIAVVDVLSQGFYSRLMRRVPSVGPSLVSWVWWSIYTGYVIGSCISGPITDKGLPFVPVYIAAGFQLACGVCYVFNWYGEKKNRLEREDDVRQKYIEELKQQFKTRPSEASERALLSEEGNTSCAAPEAEAGEGVPVTEEEQLEMRKPSISTCLCGLFEVNKGVVTNNWRVVVYAVIMTASVLTLAVVTLLADKWGLLYACIATAVVCCGAAFWALPLTVAKAAVFIYIHKALYLSIPGALNNFYVATPSCLEDGPHFSYTFYYTISRIITSVAGMIGASLFAYCFSKRSYRLTFVIVTVLQVVASLFDLIIVKRWNISIGIPDHAMYLFGDAIVYEVVDALSSMPLQILMSRVCPRGSESMLFALMAGLANMGGSMAYSIGSLLMEMVWPVSKCEFSNVPMLIIVGHLALPMASVPLVFLLLPSAGIHRNLSANVSSAGTRSTSSSSVSFSWLFRKRRNGNTVKEEMVDEYGEGDEDINNNNIKSNEKEQFTVAADVDEEDYKER